jgi:predicted dinucleotide-binding enzyme
MFDANGSNTTAAAAALAALTSVGGSLDGAHAVVLPATGPVGQRVARLLSRLGASVSIGSRDLGRAQSLTERLRNTTGGRFEAFTGGDPAQLNAAIAKASVVVAAGPEGAQVLPSALWQGRSSLRVVVDLNAVPPLGVEGIEATDKNAERHGTHAWGALGVGGLKMKIHKKAVKELFNANDKILDAEEVLELGRDLV